MLLTSLTVDPAAFERETGWSLKPEGACKEDRCIPISDEARRDMRALADRMGMPLVHDEANDLWALGPEAGGHALTSAVASELTLPDRKANEFRLSSLRGQKVLLVAWASW